jgi:D-3-phosphoglycerate dehydrogenase / 2-oxoglutarate reductase
MPEREDKPQVSSSTPPEPRVSRRPVARASDGPGEPLVLICGLDHAAIAEESEVFGAAGVRFAQVRCHSEDDFLRACGDADGLLIQYGVVNRRVLEGLPRVRFLVRYGVGVDGIDLAAATARGIPVVNVPDYGTDEVANHAVALLLALARKLPQLDRQTRAGRWNVFEAAPIHRLAGQTGGILGCGRIGSRVARKLGAFDLRLLACDPYLERFPSSVEPVAFDRLLAESDYLTLHCPLTTETHHLIDAAALGRMKPTAVLVNTARGGVVDTVALTEALRQGRLAGAALDVTEQEPLDPESPLFRMEQVIVTPHAAWYSEESRSDLKRRVAEETVRLLRGERPQHCVNPEVFARAL